MNAEKTEFATQFRNRTKQFAVDIIKYFRTLPKTEEARIVGKQLLRSATSVAANYSAVCRARSKAEFFAKLSITVEESDESLLWLEIILNSEIDGSSKTKTLMKEAEEILAVLSKARKTTSENY